MTTKRQGQLTREAIVDASIRVAGRDGLAKLSMRNLAKEVGFEVMSLYTHVSNKADLHSGMVEHSVQELDLPEIDDSFEWRSALRQHALDLKELFERHPWLVELWLRSIPGPRRFDLMEWQLAAFAASGMSEPDAHRAYHAFFNHTVGYMLQRHAMTGDSDSTAIEKMISTLDPVRHTNVLHHVDQHRNGDIGDSFEFTLDLLLDSYPRPEGYRSVTTRIAVADVAGQVEFLRRVFDGVGEVVEGRPAEIVVGDSMIMVGPIIEREPFPAFLYMYVDDADQTYERALAAGADVVEEPRDTPYGDRRAMVRDPHGNLYQIAHRTI